MNVALGFYNLHGHAKFQRLSVPASFFSVGFCCTSFLIRLARYAMTPAAINLEKVMKATGAKFTGHLVVEMPVKHGKNTHNFYVAPGTVSLDGDYETCYQYSDAMPHEESIASVLLLLKNDPAIFWDWVNRIGPVTRHHHHCAVPNCF